MPSTQFPGDAKRGAALLDLHRRVGAGEGFANACAVVAHRFQIDHDALECAYREACRALARDVAAPSGREPLEGMLVLDIEVGDQAAVPSFSEVQARRAAS